MTPWLARRAGKRKIKSANDDNESDGVYKDDDCEDDHERSEVSTTITMRSRAMIVGTVGKDRESNDDNDAVKGDGRRDGR